MKACTGSAMKASSGTTSPATPAYRRFSNLHRVSQFVACGFKEFMRHWQAAQVFTSPHCPQSNGKLERFHSTLKQNAIRPRTSLTLKDVRHIVCIYINHFNEVCPNSAIDYPTPKDHLEGCRKPSCANANLF